MTTTKSLTATKREGTGKGAARKLRHSGRVPAVLYGKDMEPVHLSVDSKEVEHLFHAISVENTILDLTIDGEKDSHQILVREIQSQPDRPQVPVHIDFLRIQKGVKVDVEIPVDLVGVPVGVRMLGGVLEQVIHELPVRCLPALIPESIEVDVTGLSLDDSVHVADLNVPEGVEVTIDTKRTVCLVAAPRVEKEPEPAEGEVVEGEEGAEPERIGEASDENEGED
jgi:large subunit ribosomal protein L25